MYILGISCYFHDSAASLIKDGVPIACAEEERFSRIKHDNSFPMNAIDYCLKEAGIDVNEVDIIVFYEKPFLKFDRILQTCVQTFPKSFCVFYEALPQWLTEKLRIPSILKKNLGYNGRVWFVEHHKSHAASAFLVSPFKDAAILTIDAIGEWSSTSIHYGKENNIRTLKVINFPHSLGLFYSTITAYLGFRVLNDEYKVMGLAAWGEPKYIEEFKELIEVKDDGSFKLNMEYFTYTHKKKMFSKKLEDLLGPAREPESEITQRHMDIAATLQKVTEDVILKMVRYAHKLTKSENLCMAGGVALNCVANGRILMEGPFKNVFIQPASSDAGGSLGAAMYAYNSILKKPRRYVMKDVYLGPSFTNIQIKNFLDSMSIEYEKLEERELISRVARLLADNKIVGWFQGRMEFGPRALGNRSILANPSNPKMKDVINERVKHREWFRPFAPSILLEDTKKYLGMCVEAPFMIITFEVKRDRIREIISATHIDGTARIQTVSRETNRLFYELIKEFKNITGVGALLNTSFNVRGEPIVCSPRDAYACFKNTAMDYLVLGNYLISKK